LKIENVIRRTSLLFANLDRRAGKAVRSRHCPATVMRNEAGIVPLPVKAGRRRRREDGHFLFSIYHLSFVIGHLRLLIGRAYRFLDEARE
jgi:hypothetical protein